MTRSRNSRRGWTAAALAVVATAGAVIIPTGTAAADVCVGAGRRINISGCTNFANVYAPPPAAYAPLPEDIPPPPPPVVNGCVGWNGRWVSANTCR